MDTLLADPAEIEALELAHSNENARQRIWEAHGTQAPLDDLYLFFSALSGKKVLDVGCGWGYYVHEFLEAGLSYQGIDLSPEMVKLSRLENPGVQFDVHSYRNLPFADNTFDGLWCCCIFGGEPKHTMPKVLTELKRVLKPDGVMTVIVPITHGSVDEPVHDDDGNLTGWYACYEPLELHQLLESVGFSDVASFDRRHYGAAAVQVRK